MAGVVISLVAINILLGMADVVLKQQLQRMKTGDEKGKGTRCLGCAEAGGGTYAEEPQDKTPFRANDSFLLLN